MTWKKTSFGSSHAGQKANVLTQFAQNLCSQEAKTTVNVTQ